MKYLTLFLLGLVAIAAVARPAAATMFPYPVHRTTLKNGLKVLLIPMPSEGQVTYWSVVRTGARDEVEEGVTGFAHFFEHMMFRGSEKYPGPVYDGIVTSMGADANAYTTDDLTAYHLTLTREDLPTVIEIESDRFQNLKYGEEDFKTESGAVYGEFRKGRTNPFFVLYEATLAAAFEKHTYKHTTIGFEADIKKMPEQFEYSKGFFRRFYRPENVVILVAGDFDTRSTLELIRKGYEGWNPGYQAPKIPEEPPQTEQKRIDVPFEGQTLPILSINFKGDRLKAGDKLMVAATVLGELAFGETSPLYRKLVLNEQRLQFLEPDFGYNRDPKLWSVFAMVKEPGDVWSVESEIWSTIERLQREPVSVEELDATRSKLKYSFLSRLSTPSRVASSMARLIALTGDVLVVDELFATYETLTPEDLQAAARKFLRPERSTVAVLHTAGQELAAPATELQPVLLPVPEDPNIVLKAWFRAGSQDDPPGREGLANLTAMMVSEGGTRNLSYEEILKKLYPLAGHYDASVDKEMTVFTGVAHREVFDRFYGIYLDALLNPGFRQDDFDRLRSRTLTEIEKELRYSSDEELGKATLYGRVFRKTPYGHLIMGTVSGLKAITLDDVKAFHAAHYTRENLVAGLGGAYGERLPDRYLADLQRLPEGFPEAVPPPDPTALKGRQVLIVQKPEGKSTAISFGYPIDLHRGSREYYALWVANSWLGEHRNSVSHLYQVIREYRGMNYGDYSYIEVFPNGGSRNMPPTGVGRRQHLFEVWIRPVPADRAVFALRAALREVEKLSRTGLTREQFETQRNFLKKYSLQFATTTSARLGYAVDDLFYGVDDSHLARFRRMMDEITLEEVNSAIRKYMQVDDLVIAMITGEAGALKDTLVSGEPTPIDYGEVNKSERIHEEDREIAAYPLEITAKNVKIVPVEEMFEK